MKDYRPFGGRGGNGFWREGGGGMAFGNPLEGGGESDVLCNKTRVAGRKVVVLYHK